MKTRKLFTSLAAAVMLSAGLAGSGVAMNAQAVHADTTQSAKKGTISLKRRTTNATVNSDKPKLYVASQDNTSLKPIDSNYTKGQTIQVRFSTDGSKQGSDQNQTTKLYYVENKTIDGKDQMVFILSSDVTPASTVPTYEEYQKQAETDAKAVQEAYNNRDLEYLTITPKSKKGAKIYYAYKKTKKSKKIYFKATKKKIKKGKKYKTSMIVKHGKTKYAYIGKKRYVKYSAMKVVSAKYNQVKLPDDLKNLVIEN